MKITLATVLSIAAFAVPGVIPWAQAAPVVTLSADTTTPAAGGTVTVTVNISTAAPFACWGECLHFDNTRLALVSQAAGSFSNFVADSRELAAINASGEVRAGGDGSADNLGGSGSLGVFTFQALAAGATSVTTEPVSAGCPFGDVLFAKNGTQMGVVAGGSLDLAIHSATTPSLGVSPAALNFSGPVGGPNPSIQNITVTNAGGGSLVWTVSDNTSWLVVTPASGTLTTNGSATLQVVTDVTGLAAGLYDGMITITATGAANSPQTISVVFAVNAQPMIGLSTGTLAVTAPVGGPNPAVQDVMVTNAGAGLLNYSVSGNASWLSVSPASGTCGAGGTAAIHALVDATGLSAGTFNGTITVSALGAANSPQTISVILTVTANPVIGLSTASLVFNSPEGGPNAGPQSATLTNAGGGILNWSAACNSGWLSVAPNFGNLSAGASQGLTVSADVTGLAAGTHSGMITVTAAGAANSPRTIAVTLEVSSLPVIGLSKMHLAYSASVGGLNPAIQSITLSNAGAGLLHWSMTDNAAWLKVTPASGVLGAGASVMLSCAVDVSGLPAGVYAGIITVSDPGASDNPQLVDVSLTVAAVPVPPVITSALTWTGTIGTAFSYQITATNVPVNFGASGLPAGLSVDTATGLISGTPTTAGVTNVTISATNAAGTATASVVITIVSANGEGGGGGGTGGGSGGGGGCFIAEVHR